MGLILDGYPTWNQLRDPDQSGVLDPFSSTDCGEECCSIVQWAKLHQYTTEGQVRKAMPGHNNVGLTTSADIDAYLSKVGLYPLVQDKPGGALKAAIKAALTTWMPVISLGHYVSPTVLHWVVIIGYGNDHAIYCDPWYGEMLCSHWAKFTAQSTGTIISVGTWVDRK